MSVQTVLAFAGLVFGSVGFWNLLLKALDKKSAKTKLLMGIAYHNICELCLASIQRGYISADEYADLRKYFYTPYRNMGGNGVCERLMNEVDKLPIKEDE